jgi:hypothetical protein
MKILVISTECYGLVSGFVDEMRSQGHEVVYLDNGDIGWFQYLSARQRAWNFFSRLLLRKNLKKEYRRWSISRFLAGFSVGRSFDITILNYPDIFDQEHLQVLKGISSKLVCHLWDSADKMPGNLKHIDMFDVVLSFDHEDVAKYGFLPITNYLDSAIKPLERSRQLAGDVFGIFSYDKHRYQLLCHFLDSNPDLKCRFIVYIHHPRRRKYVTDPRIEVVTSPLIGDELTSISNNYPVILDLSHVNQRGLSFRFFESTGRQQKLITTNKNVLSSDMYNKNNVFVLDEAQPAVPSDFCDAAYTVLSDEVVAPFRLANWVVNLLSKISHGVTRS